MRLLTLQDFELLVALVFANSGWRRAGQVGNTQKTVDIELMLPTTGERAFLQIKSAAGNGDLADYGAPAGGPLRIADVVRLAFRRCGEADGDNVELVGP